MPKQDFVLNTHLFADQADNGNLKSNTKIGWQSSRVSSNTQSNIKSTMDMIAAWIADGTLKDGDIVTTHTQITFTKDAAPLDVGNGLVVNGKTVKPKAPAAADTDEVPF